MIRAIAVFAVVSVLGGCATTQTYPERTLTVRWQRLVDETGETCRRCGSTQREVHLAVDTLDRSLRPLNMKVVLQKLPLTPEQCAEDISQSNRIFVDRRPLADWLNGTIAMSPCETCCPAIGPTVECRTLTVGEQTYEVIPATLIVRAGLRAAEAALADEAATGR
jgi:hypothetical protein